MKVAVVASGELAPGDAGWLDGADLIIAADGGAASLDAVGRAPDRLIGDLDSIEPALVGRLEAAGTAIERHRPDKDASDAELSVEAAIALGATEIVLLGAFGGARIDHELANVLMLGDPALAGVDIRAIHGRSRVRALAGGRRLEIDGEAGDLVTLLPVGGDALGVTTEGLRWVLDEATLHIGRSRGLSNVIDATPASVRLRGGTLLVVETTA